MQVVMEDIQHFCGLPNIQGAIDDTHIKTFKPLIFYLEDYFYHKTKGYLIVAQTHINKRKRFLNVFMGLLGNVNDSQVLHKPNLHRNVQFGRLFNVNIKIDGIHPCCNPNLGLTTKARACKVAGQEKKLGSERKCEGICPHTPKGASTLGVGVLVDSRMFRKRL